MTESADQTNLGSTFNGNSLIGLPITIHLEADVPAEDGLEEAFQLARLTGSSVTLDIWDNKFPITVDPKRLKEEAEVVAYRQRLDEQLANWKYENKASSKQKAVTGREIQHLKEFLADSNDPYGDLIHYFQTLESGGRLPKERHYLDTAEIADFVRSQGYGNNGIFDFEGSTITKDAWGEVCVSWILNAGLSVYKNIEARAYSEMDGDRTYSYSELVDMEREIKERQTASNPANELTHS